MAKKSKTAADNGKSSTASKSQTAGLGGESVHGYFRGVFKENRKVIWERSNDVLFERWLRDHPGEKEVPVPPGAASRTVDPDEAIIIRF